MSSEHNLLANIGSILQDKIKLCIFIKQKFILQPSYSLANENTFCTFFKIMRRLCFIVS